MATKGLGRGLASLFADIESDDLVIEKAPRTIKDEVDEKAVTQIPLYLIDANPDQPRKQFDEGALRELADSIRTHGVIQPVVLTKRGTRYMVIAGERRLRAARLAGLDYLPAVVRDYTERQIKEISLIENLQREDLNPIEAAEAIDRLMKEFNCTQEVVAERIGKSRSVIANTLRLLRLEPEVIDLVKTGRLSAGHARCLVAVDHRDTQIKLANQVKDNKMSVRDLEKLVKRYTDPDKFAKSATVANQSSELKELIHGMQKVFATKVKAIGNDTKGRIYIDYYTRDDLDRIHEIIANLGGVIKD